MAVLWIVVSGIYILIRAAQHLPAMRERKEGHGRSLSVHRTGKKKDGKRVFFLPASVVSCPPRVDRSFGSSPESQINATPSRTAQTPSFVRERFGGEVWWPSTRWWRDAGVSMTNYTKSCKGRNDDTKSKDYSDYIN